MRLSSLLFTVFVVTPLVEIGLFIAVGTRIGLGPTLLIVVGTAVLGASLVSRQSRSEWARVRADFAAGVFPGRPLAHSAMILVAGTLLITPGFLTDAIGFSLLIPGVREALRQWGVRRYQNRTTVL
ncbi:MAG: FxsA family protein [Acidimicrobiia bacterium]